MGKYRPQGGDGAHLRMSGEVNGLKVVGKPLPKVDAATKVTGRAVYADDMLPARTLHCKILRSPHPHARILSIDTSAARRIPGVIAVITGNDLPVKFGILPVTQDERALEQEMSIDAALEPPRDEPIQDYGGPNNVHKFVALEFGDVDAGFSRAEHIREDVFFFQGNTHLPMEQHSAIATFVDGKVTLWSSTQVV